MAFLALNMVFRKFPFSQVKLHLNTHNIHLGQHALGPSCYIEYGCANFWCQKPTYVECMQYIHSSTKDICRRGLPSFWVKILFSLKVQIQKNVTNRSSKAVKLKYSLQVSSQFINPVQRNLTLKFITQPVLKMNTISLIRSS